MDSSESSAPLAPIDWARLYKTWGVTTTALEGAYSPARLLDVLTRYMPSGSGSKVLELGCAPGRWLGWVQDKLGMKAVGIELDRVGLRLARTLYPAVQLVRGDATRLPLLDQSFDAVFSIGLLEHFMDPGPILREARRVLRVGGVCVSVMPNLGPGTLHRWHWKVFQRRFFEAHRPYTLPQLSAAVGAAGLQVIHSEHNGLYIPHLQRLMGRLPIRQLLSRLERPWLASNLVVVALRSRESRRDNAP